MAFVLAALFTLIVVFFTIEKFRGRAAWKAYEKDATARGVKLTLAEFVSPNIPDAENFASVPVFEAAFRASEAHQLVPNPFRFSTNREQKLPKLSDPMEKPIDWVEWQKLFISTGALSAAGDDPARDVLKALESIAEPLAQLGEAGTRPHCRFPVHWERSFNATLPHLEILMQGAKAFSLRLSARLAVGDSAGAYEDFRDGMRMVTATEKEPTLIAGLVRAGMANTMINALWGGLVEHQWAEPELQKIEADLAAFDWLRSYTYAMSSERAGMNAIIDVLIENPRQLGEMTRMVDTTSNSGDSGQPGLLLYPNGWIYQNKVRMNQFFDQTMQRVIPEQRRYQPGLEIPASPARITSIPERIYYLLVALLAPAFESIEMRFLHMAALTDEARIACALERFRLTHGKHPAQLTELMPSFISALPNEVMNGEPYRYRPSNDGGYLLYSVGANLRDDGGSIAPNTNAFKQADWIWSSTRP
jgi:hypothetical protein